MIYRKLTITWDSGKCVFCCTPLLYIYNYIYKLKEIDAVKVSV